MSGKKLEDLKLTQEEISRLEKAFKDESFRKLFAEYAEEISDPENRKKYEEEIEMLENERGMDVKFVKPEPGYVLKTATVSDNIKAFVNICKNQHIEEARCNREIGPGGKSGLNWSIPHSFAPVREDVDKQGNKCKVFDFVIHPNTYRMAETNVRFMKLIEDTALTGTEKQFGIRLDRKNYKKPKITFKGTPTATVIRSRKDGPVPKKDPEMDVLNKVKYPYDNKTSEEKAKELSDKVAKEINDKKKIEDATENDNEYQQPSFMVKHRSNVDLQDFTDARDSRPSTRPVELCVEIDLPLLKSAASVELDIFEKKLKLCSEKVAKYKLDLDLPYEVDEENGNAKFDKSKRKLVVTLPVVPAKITNALENGSLDDDMAGSTALEDEAAVEFAEAEKSEPLIEILSSEDYHGRDGVDEANASSENSSEETDMLQEHDDTFVQVAEDLKSDIFYAMPSFDYLQDDETVTFILDVKKVKKDTVTKTFIAESDRCVGVDIKLKSVGSGGFPMHFRFMVKLLSPYQLDKNACYFDVGEQNLVATLVKTEDCLGPWEKFMVGSDGEKLEEKVFLSDHFVRKRLDRLDKEHAESGMPTNMPELEVTDMNTSQLLLDIKESHGNSHSMSESAEEIEVVHDKQQPKLHGILKQRSRTTSESSDDILSSSYNRQYSTGGESSPTPLTEESEEDQGEGSMKKSVSFSEEVDRTLYKVNQSVTSMRSTLKNKRKKAQKKEKKQAEREKKRTARRRRNSNSLSEPSSDEPSLSENINEERERIEDKECVGDDDEVVADESKDECNGLSMEESSVENEVSKDAKVTESESVATVKGTSENDGSSNEVTTGCDNESSRVTNGSLHNGGVDERTCDSDDDNNSDEIRCNGVQQEAPDVMEVPPKPDTVLSWKDGTSSAVPKPQCAVEFSNNVMFELDLD